jgi:hypothetical protein
MLRPMAATGVPLGDVVIVLTFAVMVVAAAAAAAVAAMGVLPGDEVMVFAFMVTAAAARTLTFGGGEVGVHNIVLLLEESWV